MINVEREKLANAKTTYLLHLLKEHASDLRLGDGNAIVHELLRRIFEHIEK